MKTPKHKKTCFISTEFPPGPGGIGAHADNLVNELKKLNWDTTVFTIQDNAHEGEIKTFNKDYHSKIIRLFPSPSVVALIKKVTFIIKNIRQKNPDIIISSGKHSIWFGAIAKIILRKPLVIIAHGTEFGFLSERNFKINRWSLSKANLIIAVSNYTLDFLKRNQYPINSAKVIYNGANPDTFYKLEQSEILNFRKSKKIEGKFIILTLGNLSHRKGQLEVIKSLPEIFKKHNNVHYYCIGLPSIKEELLKEAETLGVLEHLHILGKLPADEINKWLNAADLFAMLSTHTKADDFEGFGISVIEAALCGKPAIVTSDTSGVIESIIPNETGIGVPEKDYIAISNCIIHLIENPQLLKTMGDKAYQRAVSEFTWQHQAKKYDACLRAL